MRPLLVITALLLTGLLRSAVAHEAMSGWQYPWECCADQDCKQIPDEAVTEGPDVYVIRLDGREFIFPRERIRFSPDGHYHACHQENAGELLCFFVPPKGF